MSSEERKRGDEARSAEPPRVEAQPRNWLVPVILLALREWNSYGYELMQRTTALGFEAMNTSTFYRTLRRMEGDGVVRSAWETSKGGPARRMYTITDAGEAYLNLWSESLKQYQQMTNAFFRIYYGLPARDGDERKGDG
jgi:PadR family transcriptional regulator PadR